MRRPRSILSRYLPPGLYFWIILLIGMAAAVRMGTQPGKATGTTFVVLLFFACATAPLKVHLPGADHAVSLSSVFTFAAITELPAGYALFIVSVALLYQSLVYVESLPRWREIAFDLASASVATLFTYRVYCYLNAELGLKRLLSLVGAAVTYFAITSATGAVQIALQSGEAPWRIWNRRFFWTAPLYLLAAVAVDMTQTLLDASTASQRLMALALIFLGYRYVKHYFGRLHDQQDHGRKMEELRQRTIEALAVAIEAKDGATAGHLRRVKRNAIRLAKKLRFSEIEIKTVELGAVLHDVGKVAVADYVLGKPGRLTENEFNQIAVHATVGADIVSAVQFPYPVEEVVLSHHEHWDGSGYPRQLKGPQIPRLARVLTVVDCFDALVSDRPYRAALPVQRAVELMREQREKLFDPEILDAFLDELPDFVEDLQRELDAERSQLRLAGGPTPRVRQTWLTDAEFNEAALRLKTLEKLASTPEQLVLLYDILQILGADLETPESLKRTLAMLQRVIPHQKAGIFILEGENYVLVQGEGIPEHCNSRLALPALQGAMAEAAAARKPVIAEGPPVEFHARVAPRYWDDVRCTLAAPLILDEAVIGGVALCSSATRNFDQGQAWFLSLITGKLASTVASIRALEKLRLDATTDPLTKLLNARATFQTLEKEIGRASREGTSLAVLFMDLDRLKPVNDSHGHRAGDKLLSETAQRLRAFLRTYDSLGRVGGDEFLAILTGIDPESLPARVMNLEQAVARNVVTVTEGVEVATTISIGVACYPQDGADAEELIFRSDQRMYIDKSREPTPVERSLGLEDAREATSTCGEDGVFRLGLGLEGVGLHEPRYRR